MSGYILDTSVLTNCLYNLLPDDLEEDVGAVKLLDSGPPCVISEHVEEEFNRLIDRRYALYADVVDWMSKTESEIFDYEPDSRNIHVSYNDRSHFRNDIQMSWHDKPQREQLSDLRRCHQNLDKARDTVIQMLEDVLNVSVNGELLAHLRGLGIQFDANVVAEAVEIHRQEGISSLVARDNHFTNPSSNSRINEAIRRIENANLELEFIDITTLS